MTVPARRRVLWTVAAALFANSLALLGLTPLYPVVARDLWLGPDSFSIYFAIQGAINVILQIPVGVVADRVGRRLVMTIGLLFMIAGQLARWHSSNAIEFGIGQVFIGLCGPCVVASAFAAVADAFETSGRAEAIGVIQAAVNLGIGAGFVLAGLLSQSAGWRGYSLIAATLPILLLPLAARMPEPPHRQEAGSLGASMWSAIRFLTIPPATGMAIVAALTAGAYTGATYLLPFIAHANGVSEGTTGLLLLPVLFGSIASGWLAGKWADRVGVRTPALTAIGATIVALIAFGVFGFGTTAVVACYLVIGAGVSATIALAVVLVADLANHRGIGTGAALGGMRVGQGLGPTLGPSIAGLLLVRTGSSIAYFALAGGVTIAGGLVYITSANRLDRAT
jgi:MFS family permease